MATDKQLCAICGTMPATTREHVPAEQFFSPPRPGDLSTVPSCEACNKGSQRDDEYLRAHLLSLRNGGDSRAAEVVRDRLRRQLHRPLFPGLLKLLRGLSEFRLGMGKSGEPTVALYIRPDADRVKRVLTKYVRGIYYHVTGSIMPPDVIISMERTYSFGTQSPEQRRDLLAAEAYAAAAGLISIGTGDEFQYAFRAPRRGAVLAVLVLVFYRSFSYVATVFRPGTDLSQPVEMPY